MSTERRRTNYHQQTCKVERYMPILQSVRIVVLNLACGSAKPLTLACGTLGIQRFNA